MDLHKGKFIKFTDSNKYLPQEEILEKKGNKNSLTIGVPKEISFQESRIALAPQAAGLLIANGHKILIETGAGKAAHFPDKEYSDAGALIVSTSDEIYKSDIILKIAPPTFNELNLLKNTKQTIFSSLNFTGQNIEFFKKLMLKKTTAISIENIKDNSGSYPIKLSMSEIAGTSAILIASEYLSNPKYGKGSLLGGFPGVTPTEIVILGAGTVAEFAARAALGLGAVVKVFDNSIYKLRKIQNNLNSRIFTSIFQPAVLRKALKTADVAIGALNIAEDNYPFIVSDDMVQQMKYGSVIVDVSIDQGGCFETSHVTTHSNPVYKKYDVTHYCVPNIPSRVPHTASYALSNFFTPIILEIGEKGGVGNFLKSDKGTRNGCYIYNGTLIDKNISNRFNIPYQDIELLMAAFH